MEHEKNLVIGILLLALAIVMYFLGKQIFKP